MAENKLTSPKSILIFVIVLFVLIALLSVASYLSSLKKPSSVAVQPTEEPTVTPTPEPTVLPTPISTIDISDWVIYQNRSKKYELKIPPDWIKEDDGAYSKKYFSYPYGELGSYQILHQPEAGFVLYDKAFGKKPTECDGNAVEQKNYNNGRYIYKICEYKFSDAADIEFDIYAVYTEIYPYMEMTYKIKSDLEVSVKEKYENIFYQVLNSLTVN